VADDAGGFVAFVDLGSEGGETRRLDLSAEDGAGTTRRSREPVIVASPGAAEPDAEPLVLAAREEGVELLQGPRASAAEGVTIELSRQDRAGGPVALSGRAEGLSRIKVFADARLVAETVADADGRWTAEIAAEDAEGADRFGVEAVGSNAAATARASAPVVLAEEGRARGLAPGEIMVRQGDTLWRIAENLFGDGLRYTVIYQANEDRIRDPDLIFPGQALTVPGAVSAQ
jgi:nucleoid-associated protein YgaU